MIQLTCGTPFFLRSLADGEATSAAAAAWPLPLVAVAAAAEGAATTAAPALAAAASLGARLRLGFGRSILTARTHAQEHMQRLSKAHGARKHNDTHPSTAR